MTDARVFGATGDGSARSSARPHIALAAVHNSLFCCAGNQAESFAQFRMF